VQSLSSLWLAVTRCRTFGKVRGRGFWDSHGVFHFLKGRFGLLPVVPHHLLGETAVILLIQVQDLLEDFHIDNLPSRGA